MSRIVSMTRSSDALRSAFVTGSCPFSIVGLHSYSTPEKGRCPKVRATAKVLLGRLAGEIHFALDLSEPPFQDADALLEGHGLTLRLGEARLVRFGEGIERLEDFGLAVAHRLFQVIEAVLELGA